MRRIALLLMVPLMCLLPARADAVTFRDVIELTRAGLGEEILLALIEVDRSVFPIDAASLKQLKEAGVSERVILAMVRSGREVQPVPDQIPVDAAVPPVAPQPQVIVIDHHEPPEIREVPVAVPVYIPVATRSARTGRVHDGDQVRQVELSFGQTVTVPASDHRVPVKQQEPVYWGWGGKLRPDAWGQPSPPPTDPKKTTDSKKQ
jgi:hypothetical protein